ncbi:MAG: alpha/beta hydrolase family protein [Ignavibacteriales bacterium]|nr:alpha/beta hydrolase family protein [Ignavibacteriales bacterium]
MKKIFFLLLLISLGSTSFPQEKLVLSADYIPHSDTSLIFLPKDYSLEKTYPLVFLLHGWSGNYKHWNELTDGLQKYSDKYDFILVCPHGFYDSWYIDSPVNPKSQMETFFIKNLIPAILEKYKVNKENIFITGLSMGGHGAYFLFLKHQDLFKSAGSLSGILDITEFPNRWSMVNAFGKTDSIPDVWKNSSVYNLLDSLKDKNREFIFSCGTEDFAYGVNKKFYEKCLLKKLKATFISNPGLHRADYWKNNIECQLSFFRKLVEK